MRLIMTLLLTSVALLGCDGKGDEAGNKNTTTKVADGIPPITFMADRPANVKDLVEVKKNAKVGDPITFLARVGGRGKPFVGKQAIFVAADPSLQSCELIAGEDHCRAPWDYCCEDKVLLLNGMATIRILGGNGHPLGINAKGAGGLQVSKFIVVQGTVSDRNDEGLFIVDASRIWVGGKPTYEDPRKGSM